MTRYRVLAIKYPGIESTFWVLQKRSLFFWIRVDSAYDYGKERIFSQFNALSAGRKKITSVEIDTIFHPQGIQL